jgi:hypothetical protein
LVAEILYRNIYLVDVSVVPSFTTTQSKRRKTQFKKRHLKNTSGKDVTVCNKCHNKGHLAASCRSSWTKEGKYIGEGEPPADHYWTQRNAAELKQKNAAMVKKTSPQQQQQQPAQKHNRNAEKDFEEGLLKQQKRKKTIQA